MKRKQFLKSHKERGFTLVELMVATGVFVLAFAGILLTYVKCMELNELSRNSSYAMSAVTSRVEQIVNTTTSSIESTYDDVTFTDSNLNGIGVSTVTNSTDYLTITVTFCWRQKNGKVVGEDANLDGQLSASEDANSDGDGEIDSPVQIVTRVDL